MIEQAFLQLSDYTAQLIEAEMGAVVAAMIAALGFVFKTWRTVASLDKKIEVIHTWIMTRFKIDLREN